MSKLKKSVKQKTVQAKEKMTAERLCNFKGFENYTTAEANEVITKLEHLAKVVCYHVQNIN